MLIKTLKKLLLPLCCLGFLAVGCTPQSLDDFRNEGESVARFLVNDLQQIQSYDDLLAAAPRLKKRFSRLVDLMIQAKTYTLKNPFEGFETQAVEMQISERLLCEVERIYAIDNCRELMESLQRDSLHRLDDFHQSIQSKY